MNAPLPLTQHVSAFFKEELTQARGVSKHTYKSYWVSLRFLNSFLVTKLKKPLARINADELKYEHIYEWILYENNKRCWGDSTWNSRLAAVKAFVRYLARTDIRYLDLASRTSLISAKRVRTREPDFLTLEEFETILDNVVIWKQTDFRDKLICQMLFFSGARVEEISGLKLTDIVEVGRNSVNLQFFGKGRKTRNVPLLEKSTNSNLMEYIERLIRSSITSSYLFPGNKGEQMNTENIRRIVKKHFADNCFGKHVTPHTFRHSAAMQWILNGVSLFMLSTLLGHKDTRTTIRYLHATFELKADALEAAGQDQSLSQLFNTDFTSNEDFWESIKVTV